MSESVNLPALGESVTEGTVTRWLKQVGDRIEVDEPLLEVSTDKVDTEIPSPVAGVLEEILVAEDETAEVGSPLAKIGSGENSEQSRSAGDSAAAAEDPEPQASSAPAAEEDAPAAEAASAHSGESTQNSDSTESSQDSQEVTLPALGESVTEGTVTRWLKAIGDTVETDEPLLEVSTDKVDTEIPSPVAGTLLEIKVAEDETAEVGSVLALIGSSSGSAAASETEKKSEPSAPAAEPKAEKKPEPAQAAPAQTAATEPADPKSVPKESTEEAKDSGSSAGAGSNYVTPLVRKLANQQGVDLSSVSGTGVGGRIRKQDVLSVAEAASSQQAAQASSGADSSGSSGSDSSGSAKAAAPASALRGTVEKAPRIRQVIARRMRESLDTSAQLTQVHEVDMTRIAKLRNAAKNTFQAQNGGVKLTFLPFIAKAVAEALKQHPKLNASYDEEKQEVTYHDAEHLAIAVDTDRGLLVPVISDAGNLNLAGMAGKIADVATRTRNNKIGPDELSGGTFSITNFGSVGALFDTPIINQPQVAILGVGTIVKRPVVVPGAEGEDTIAIRQMMYLSLTYDHRLVDGADAGRFLQTLKARLESGAFEADLGL
ncbi:2-oxoglutarate dehydrogenase, E2 component, dihydrolipoamide succinyltransferase [Acaricomes phytoseiuli]|uniref:2-oxoglutarate dehydrogenase, E2 component, dihydrolipoamide succinyltransferase n=1 Tax=Acaricomes phytoseiuli TaxID=291968 RepID=UPI0022226BC3|nr:2-oxoglutarate dehydrogenase, E2 component, dihydrolipoamide succinyltransferase [Acaricomes phytoseiuli]MCW1249102.1 2-oxoglutarate dehydrogenase, E2 component, dihydrolipoamide succinyltransferase [Acaricomes phytoseiuli]